MLSWSGIFVLLSAASSLKLDVFPSDIAQEHGDVHVQLIYLLQLDDIDNTKIS